MNLKDFYQSFGNNLDINKRERYLTKLKTIHKKYESRMPLKKRLSYKNPICAPTTGRVPDRTYHCHKCLEKTQVAPETIDTCEQNGQSYTMSLADILQDWSDSDSTNDSTLQYPEMNDIFEKTSTGCQTELPDYKHMHIISEATDESNTSKTEKRCVHVASQTDISDTLHHYSEAVTQTDKVNIVSENEAEMLIKINKLETTIKYLQNVYQNELVTLPHYLESDSQTDDVNIISTNEKNILKIIHDFKLSIEDLQYFHQNVNVTLPHYLESVTQTDDVTIINDKQKELLKFMNDLNYTIDHLRYFNKNIMYINNNQNTCNNINQLDNNNKENNENTLPENEEKQFEAKGNISLILKRKNIKLTSMQLLGVCSDLNKLVLESLHKALNLREDETTIIHKKLCKISEKLIEEIFEIIFTYIEIKQSNILDTIDLVEDDDIVECEVLPPKRPATSEITDNNKSKQAKTNESIQKQQMVENNNAHAQQTQTTAPQQVTQTQIPDMAQRECPPPYIQQIPSMPNIYPYDERVLYMPQRNDPRLPRYCDPTQLNQRLVENALGKQPPIQNISSISQQLRAQFLQASQHQQAPLQGPSFQPLSHHQPPLQNYYNNDHNFLNPTHIPQNTFGARNRIFEEIMKRQDMQYPAISNRNSYFMNYPKR